MFIIRFLGSILSGILTRIIVMAVMVGGGAFFVQSQGGMTGVIALATGQKELNTDFSAEGMPSFAGLGGLSDLLPGATPKEPTYYTQQARISNIGVVCRLSIREGGNLNQTQPLDCSRARVAVRDPKFAGYTLQKNLTATYIYYAMDGVNVHEGTMPLTGSLKTKRVGDVIDVRVNGNDPSDSTPI
jgi:hypothetical protein